MTRSWKRTRLHWWLLLLLAISWPTSATAHGSGTPRLVNVLAGPYRLWVWSLPDPIRVGETHFSVAVEETTGLSTQQSTATAIAVQITISAPNQGQAPFTLSASKQDRFLQTYYETDFTMPAAGEWQATVQVSGSAGIGSATFAFTSLPPQQVNWELVIGGTAMLLALILGARLKRKPTNDV